MAVEITDGTLKGKIMPTINPEVQDIPITVNTTYAYFGRAIKIGKIVFVTFAIKKVIGDIAAEEADSIISGLPSARDSYIFIRNSRRGTHLRFRIRDGSLREHWSSAWNTSQGDEFEDTLIYVSK